MEKRFALFKSRITTASLIWRERVDAHWEKQDAELKENPSRWHWKTTFICTALELSIIAVALIFSFFLGGK